ncbi:MAG: GntR family transcriptional regulator, partial [Steroidobacteraceae bacterium]|nr:GntR family transcriptional regulator [Steroidobacteraceae bacterium]MDW8259174.1 GntR family transcriptional regulator [Gammaproteobacteria bacterium]
RGGSLRVGASLPGELELVQRYRVSRHTVREALRMLTDLGLIERRQGIGTVVKARRPAESYSYTVRTPSELLRYPPDSRLQVLQTEIVRVGRQLARELGCRSNSRWARIGALRRVKSSRVAICWVDIFLLPEYSGVAPMIGRREQPVYELIEQKYGEKLVNVEVDVRATLMPEPIAALLQVVPQSPSLTIVRRYIGRGQRLFEVSRSYHPADRYSFAMDLQRGWTTSDAAPRG